MRVAVVTPYLKESDDVLARCHASVLSQVDVKLTHILVSDGMPNALCSTFNAEHIILPITHDDAGATPRLIGAISAFGRGYDAVAFLDADNWYFPNHIKTVSELLQKSGSDAVFAMRSIYDKNNNFMYVDSIESIGEYMVDTNCWFLSKKMLPLLHTWIINKSDKLINDKIFFTACKQSNAKIEKCNQPTVAYVTKWAWHYYTAKKQIPEDAVWLQKDAMGNYIHVTEKDRKFLL